MPLIASQICVVAALALAGPIASSPLFLLARIWTRSLTVWPAPGVCTIPSENSNGCRLCSALEFPLEAVAWRPSLPIDLSLPFSDRRRIPTLRRHPRSLAPSSLPRSHSMHARSPFSKYLAISFVFFARPAPSNAGGQSCPQRLLASRIWTGFPAFDICYRYIGAASSTWPTSPHVVAARTSAA